MIEAVVAARPIFTEVNQSAWWTERASSQRNRLSLDHWNGACFAKPAKTSLRAAR